MGYCYIYLPNINLDAMTKLAMAMIGSAADVVVANPINNKEVSARTPLGFTYGVFNSRGDIVLDNGIKCLGKLSTAALVGYAVNYGICAH
jgi:hypothetical protein